MGWYDYHPEVNLPVLRGDFCFTHYPTGAARWRFQVPPPSHLYTQSLLYRVTGTSEADFTSGPRTRLFSNIGKSSEMLNLCLAFQTLLGLLRHRAGWTEAWIQPIYHLLYAPIIWSVPHSRIVRLSQQGSRSQYITVTNFRFLVMSRMVDIFIPHPLPAVFITD